MKLETLYIIILFATESTMAQNLAAVEKSAASNPQAGQYMQIAYAVPEERSFLEMKARAARIKFTSDPNLYSELERSEHTDAGVFARWSDRVFKRLELYAQPRRFEVMQDSRMQSDTVLNELANEGRMVTKIILKETLRYTQEQLPEIEVLIKAMKLEVSTDMIARQSDEKEIMDSNNRPVSTVHRTPVEDRFFLKTGFRIPVDGGKLGVISETEATYGNLSSFFKVRLDSHYDSTAGLIYVLSRDVRVQVDRHVTHASALYPSGTTNTKSSLDLVQLVCHF